MFSATAIVETEAAARYGKQLLAHLGRKLTVEPLPGRPEPAGRLVFSDGVGTVLPTAGQLILGASAESVEALAHVQDVLQRHLERFGARRELVVMWSPAVESTESALGNADTVGCSVEDGSVVDHEIGKT